MYHPAQLPMREVRRVVHETYIPYEPYRLRHLAHERSPAYKSGLPRSVWELLVADPEFQRQVQREIDGHSHANVTQAVRRVRLEHSNQVSAQEARLQEQQGEIEELKTQLAQGAEAQLQAERACREKKAVPSHRLWAAVLALTRARLQDRVRADATMLTEMQGEKTELAEQVATLTAAKEAAERRSAQLSRQMEEERNSAQQKENRQLVEASKSRGASRADGLAQDFPRRKIYARSCDLEKVQAEKIATEQRLAQTQERAEAMFQRAAAAEARCEELAAQHQAVQQQWAVEANGRLRAAANAIREQNEARQIAEQRSAQLSAENASLRQTVLEQQQALAAAEAEHRALSDEHRKQTASIAAMQWDGVQVAQALGPQEQQEVEMAEAEDSPLTSVASRTPSPPSGPPSLPPPPLPSNASFIFSQPPQSRQGEAVEEDKQAASEQAASAQADAFLDDVAAGLPERAIAALAAPSATVAGPSDTKGKGKKRPRATDIDEDDSVRYADARGAEPSDPLAGATSDSSLAMWPVLSKRSKTANTEPQPTTMPAAAAATTMTTATMTAAPTLSLLLPPAPAATHGEDDTLPDAADDFTAPPSEPMIPDTNMDMGSSSSSVLPPPQPPRPSSRNPRFNGAEAIDAGFADELRRHYPPLLRQLNEWRASYDNGRPGTRRAVENNLMVKSLRAHVEALTALFSTSEGRELTLRLLDREPQFFADLNELQELAMVVEYPTPATHRLAMLIKAFFKTMEEAKAARQSAAPAEGHAPGGA